ncbi:MAG TPA: hypothetical protein DD396_04635, partial [Bacteroidetes bacterium]|nr:hypothetical protein [Bacteroidota bacterium]
QQSTINSLGSNHLGFRKVVKSLTFLFITFSVLSFSIPYNKDIIPDKSSTNEVQSKNTIPASFNFTTMIDCHTYVEFRAINTITGAIGSLVPVTFIHSISPWPCSSACPSGSGSIINIGMGNNTAPMTFTVDVTIPLGHSGPDWEVGMRIVSTNGYLHPVQWVSSINSFSSYAGDTRCCELGYEASKSGNDFTVDAICP